MFFPMVQAYWISAHSRYGINAKRRDDFIETVIYPLVI